MIFRKKKKTKKMRSLKMLRLLQILKHRVEMSFLAPSQKLLPQNQKLIQKQISSQKLRNKLKKLIPRRIPLKRELKRNHLLKSLRSSYKKIGMQNRRKSHWHQ